MRSGTSRANRPCRSARSQIYEQAAVHAPDSRRLQNARCRPGARKRCCTTGPSDVITVILYTREQFHDVTRAPDWAGGVRRTLEREYRFVTPSGFRLRASGFRLPASGFELDDIGHGTAHRT